MQVAGTKANYLPHNHRQNDTHTINGAGASVWTVC